MTKTAEKKFGFLSKEFWVGKDENGSNDSQPSGQPASRPDNYSSAGQQFGANTNGMYSNPAIAPISGVGTIQQQIKQDLEQVLNESNFPGEDYLELREAIVNMTSAGLDNATAMKAAFATLKTRGLSKEKALQTANEYIAILNKYKEKFYGSMNTQTQSRIEKPQSEIQSINEENTRLAQQINEITEKINKNNDLVSKKKGEIAEGTAIIDRTKLDYDATHNACVKEIQDDIIKIQTLIQ